MRNQILRYCFTLTVLFTASFAVHATPAIFTQGELTIPEGAVITGNSNAYYTDIILAQNSRGGLIITGAKNNPLVNVANVEY